MRQARDEFAVTVFYNALKPPGAQSIRWFFEVLLELEWQNFRRQVGDDTTMIQTKEEFVNTIVTLLVTVVIIPLGLLSYAIVLGISVGRGPRRVYASCRLILLVFFVFFFSSFASVSLSLSLSFSSSSFAAPSEPSPKKYIYTKYECSAELPAAGRSLLLGGHRRRRRGRIRPADTAGGRGGYAGGAAAGQRP